MNVFLSSVLIPMGFFIEKDREDLFLSLACRHKHASPFFRVFFILYKGIIIYVNMGVILFT